VQWDNSAVEHFGLYFSETRPYCATGEQIHRRQALVTRCKQYPSESSTRGGQKNMSLKIYVCDVHLYIANVKNYWWLFPNFYLLFISKSGSKQCYIGYRKKEENEIGHVSPGNMWSSSDTEKEELSWEEALSVAADRRVKELDRPMCSSRGGLRSIGLGLWFCLSVLPSNNMVGKYSRPFFSTDLSKRGL